MNNSAPRIAPRDDIIDDVKAAIGDRLVEGRVGEDGVGESGEGHFLPCRGARGEGGHSTRAPDPRAVGVLAPSLRGRADSTHAVRLTLT